MKLFCRCSLTLDGPNSGQRNVAYQYQHRGRTMDNGAVGSAFDHAAESWDNDVVECDMVKTIVRGDAACHVSGIVMPLKKALVIEIKCLVSGVGGNLRWEDYAERSPGFTILLMRLNLFDFNARLSQ